MKIVHEIYSRAQVAGGITPYGVTKGEEGPAKGGRVDELVIVCSRTTNSMQPDDAIYFCGDARHIRNALMSALAVLEGSAQLLVEKGRLSPDWKEDPKCPTSP